MSSEPCSELFFRMALTMVPAIGPVKAGLLIETCGSARAVFKESRKSLMKIDGIGERIAGAMTSKGLFIKAEAETF